MWVSVYTERVFLGSWERKVSFFASEYEQGQAPQLPLTAMNQPQDEQTLNRSEKSTESESLIPWVSTFIIQPCTLNLALDFQLGEMINGQNV